MTDRLLVEVEFPGWQLLSQNRRERLHWSERRKAAEPPIAHELGRTHDALVNAPHPRRVVEVTRYGPRLMDEDGNAAAMKPVLDWIRSKVIRIAGRPVIRSYGYVYDDRPEYCRLVAKQEAADEYAVRVRVWEERR